MAIKFNQDIFSDDQNYKIDVEAIYKTFIKQIISIRSISNITSLDNAFDVDNHAIKISTSDTPQESLCHAFYRLIGLPVMGEDGSMYSPGFDRQNNGSDTELKNKKGVARKIPKKLHTLMLSRELNSVQSNQVFSLQSIESGILALSSLNKRNFVEPLSKSDNPFDTTDPSYSLVGQSELVKELSEYVDGNGLTIDADSKALVLSKARRHIIKPFIVNPLIDLTVNPSTNSVCAPFVNDTLLFEDNHAKFPFIELVCKIRFDGRNKTDSITESQQKVIDYIKDAESFKDLEIIKQVSGSAIKVTEKTQFLRIFNSIRAMITKLILSENTIDEVRKDILWIPIPDKRGPEYGSVTRDIVLNDPNINLSRYTKDKTIAEKTIKKRFDEITHDVLKVTRKNLNNYAFGEVQLTLENTDGFGNNNSDDLANLVESRNHRCSQANEALRIIEIIMGEFNGLGLCDIIAIYGALWLVEKKDLIGLLDDAAVERMKLIKELKEDPDIDSRSAALDAIKAFEKKVKELYELMDKIYIDARENNFNTYTSQ